jgi:hypothetical protein
VGVLSRQNILGRMRRIFPDPRQHEAKQEFDGGVVITPMPLEEDWSDDAVNLRLGNHFLLPQSPPPPFIALDNIRLNQTRVHVPWGEYLVLRRGLSALALVFAVIPNLHAQQAPPAPQRWTEAQANAWYARQPWPVGANFLPSTAINQLEMWQADYLRPRHNRPRAGLGGRHRHEHHARFSAQPALGAGSQGLRASHRPLPGHRLSPSHPARFCALRLLLGSAPQTRAAARARTRRAQLRLGAGSRH